MFQKGYCLFTRNENGGNYISQQQEPVNPPATFDKIDIKFSAPLVLDTTLPLAESNSHFLVRSQAFYPLN
jgi:hypothetical protein